MKNHVQTGVNLTLPAPYDVISGEGVVIGSIFGIAANDALTGNPVDITTETVFDLPKVAATAIAIGDKVYFDETTKLVTKIATDNTLIGVAVTEAASQTGTVNVKLVPSL